MRALGTWNKGHTERDETELYTETEAKNGTERQMIIKRINKNNRYDGSKKDK